MINYHLAIDIGASSGRHILGKIEDGKMVLEEIYRFPNGASKKDGMLVWDTEKLFFHIKEGLKKAKQIGKIPSTIGIDTWAVDYALLDKNDNLIGDVYSYRDSRTENSIDRVHGIIPFEKLYSVTGIQFQPFNTIYQLYDDVLSGKIREAKSLLMLPDYFNFLLTGVKKQEYTNATSTGLVNAVTHEWDKDIITALNLPHGLFSELVQPGNEVGCFAKEIEEEIGYCATVVLPATHDTASAVIAAPIDSAAPYISSGTWSLLGVEEDFAHTDEYSRKVNFSNEGAPDFKFRYQKNIMGLWMIQSVRHELDDKYTFAELVSLARENANDYIVDCNDSVFMAPENMTEAIERAVGKKLTVGELAYCIYNSLAVCYKTAVEELEKMTGKKYTSLNIIGGGSNNALLNELTREKTGLKIVAGPSEATAIGNMLIQMIFAKEIKDMVHGREIVKKSFEIKELL